MAHARAEPLGIAELAGCWTTTLQLSMFEVDGDQWVYEADARKVWVPGGERGGRNVARWFIFERFVSMRSARLKPTTR